MAKANAEAGVTRTFNPSHPINTGKWDVWTRQLPQVDKEQHAEDFEAVEQTLLEAPLKDSLTDVLPSGDSQAHG